MFTKKHFDVIAQIFANHDPNGDFTGGQVGLWVSLQSSLADEFRRSNPKFDVERFDEACQLKQVFDAYKANQPSSFNGWKHS